MSFLFNVIKNIFSKSDLEKERVNLTSTSRPQSITWGGFLPVAPDLCRQTSASLRMCCRNEYAFEGHHI